MDRWERLDEAIDRVETGPNGRLPEHHDDLAFLQIFLRNVFTTGLAWGDLVLRNLVLWIGFIGATLATREGKHINIDILSRSLLSSGRACGRVHHPSLLLFHLWPFDLCRIEIY